MFDYLTKTLDNGLRVVFVPMPTTSLTVNLVVAAGSKNETAKTRGVAHFLEHMAFKGTKKRPNKLVVVKDLDKIGAIYNAGTSKEMIEYFIRSTPTQLELMIDVLTDIVFNPLLSGQEMLIERGAIIEEINMYEDTPIEKIDFLFEEAVFGRNPLGWDISGTKETVSFLKRSDLLNYHQQFFLPQNMVLAIAGGLKKSEFPKILKLTQKYFGRYKSKLNEKRKTVWELSGSNLIEKKRTEQTHLVLGVPTFGMTDPRCYPAKVLAQILGGGMGSRLFLKIREELGWAYYIYAFCDFYQEAGMFGAKAGLRNDKAQEAMEMIRQEMVNFTRKLTKKEVDEAKTCLNGRYLLAIESSGRVAWQVGESWLLEGQIKTVEQSLANLKKVTTVDVIKLAKELFKEQNFCLAAIGPQRVKS